MKQKVIKILKKYNQQTIDTIINHAIGLKLKEVKR